MLRTLILLLIGISGSFALAQTRQDFAFGVALESRLQQDVNPDMGSLQNFGGLYLKYKIDSWATVLEGSQEKRESASGSLKVRTQTSMLGLWGRYEFSNGDRPWMPYLGLGLGSYFDKVNTTFQNSTDQRGGTRKFAGLSAGVTSTFFRHLLLEAEGRINFVELSKDPVFSMVFRVGAVF